MNLNTIKNIKLLSFILVFLTLITISPMAFANDYDINTAVYDDVSFGLWPPTAQSTDNTFSYTGHKFYISEKNNNRNFEFDLSTAWDISTASYNNKYYDTSEQASSLAFNNDGTKFYIGRIWGVFQYSLSTAWDISTASYDNKYINVNTQDNSLQGFKFKSDGTKLYTVGNQNDRIYQYSLSTAWDISTASYDNKYISIGTQENSPLSMELTPDGLTFLIIGLQKKVFQYDLSTAWDISTASYSNHYFFFNSENEPTGLFLKTDLSKFYISGESSDKIYQFTWAESLYLDLNISNVAYNRADFNAIVTNDYDFNLSEKGFLYNTSSDFNYSTAEFKWISPSTTDDNFSTTIEDLNHNTTYYAMAYAKDLDTNEYYYSDEQIFTTLDYPKVSIQFYDGNTFAKLDGNVSIVDLTNNQTYYADENGLFSRYLTYIDWKEKQINAYVEREVNGVTTHTSRNLQFYWKNQDYNFNFTLLPVGLGEDIEFEVRAINNDLWNNKYILLGAFPDYLFPTKIPISEYVYTSNLTEVLLGTDGVYYLQKTFNIPNLYITKVTNQLRVTNGALTNSAKIIFYYNDDTNFESTTTTTNSTSYVAKTYNNNFLTKPVNKIEVWMMQNNNSYIAYEKDTTVYSDGNASYLNSIVSSSLTNSLGIFSDYLLTSGDYNAVLYDATGNEGDTYQKTTVNVKKPKNEKSLADISPYDVQVGGLLIYSLSNQSAAQTSINIFGGTTSTYDFTVVDYNADPVDRVYIPRTYNVKNPFGSSYNTTYNLQPYLITKEDGVIPSIVVYDELKTPFPGITVAIFKQISGSLQLVEQKVTDSTGRTSFAGFPLDVYYIYLYNDGELKGSYQIQVRDTGETFYFVIQRDQVQDIIYKGLDLKYAWNNTPEYVDISTDNVDVNVSVYADYVGDFNITGYSIKTYQNGALKETETGVLSGTSVTFTESFNRLNYTAGMPIKVVVDVTFVYAGQTKNLNIIKTIAVDSKTSGLLNVLQNFPEKVGVLWTILLSILLTIGLLVLVGTSDFVSKDYLIYLGLLVIGFFVYIGWMATGIEVFGMDSMWFIYIVTVIAAVGFALQDSQR